MNLIAKEGSLGTDLNYPLRAKVEKKKGKEMLQLKRAKKVLG